MVDILSQEEINALIDTYKATGGQTDSTRTSERQVRVYDFARPDKFSKDHLRSLNVIHGKHGASFSAALSALLRVATQVELLALDQLTYREYCASVPNGTMFAEVSLEPLTSNAIFEFNPLFASMCVDLLAGAPSVTDNPVGELEITEVDKAVMRPVVELALKKYVEAWASCIELKPEVISLMTESNTRQILLPAEAVLVCAYEVTVGETESMISICIPASAVESVLPALTLGRTLNSSSRRADATNEALRKSFDYVNVDCFALLGQTSLSLEEVVNIEVGDLVRLPTRAGGEVEVWVENVPTFAGTLGVSNRKLAIRVTKSLEKAEAPA